MDNYLTSKELVHKAGISLRTLRNYRKRGLVSPSSSTTAHNGFVKFLWAPEMVEVIIRIREENRQYEIADHTR